MGDPLKLPDTFPRAPPQQRRDASLIVCSWAETPEEARAVMEALGLLSEE